MLTQTKVELKKRSQRGSVLLMVVLSIMLLFTLTTICLDVINRSTKASSRNVQKTQAKITAESVLTEFIEGYKTGRMGMGISEDEAFQGLMDMAGDAEHPTIITVNMLDSNTDDVQQEFNQAFGTTEIQIYKVDADLLKVESICTFSTQTQTASCIFKTVTKTPYVPSNTIESQQGNMTQRRTTGGAIGGVNQQAAPVEGSIYIENGKHETDAVSFSRSTFDAHLYSEYSIMFDDNTKFIDTVNKVNKCYKKDDRIYKTDPDPDDPAEGESYQGVNFKQAPTVAIEGYAYVKNSHFVMYTDVGKTDANGNVSTKTVKNADNTYSYPENPLCDTTNLGNYDGYLLIMKKWLATKPSNWKIGTATHPIDVYTHGTFFGRVPRDTIVDGSYTKNFKNEWNAIYGAEDMYDDESKYGTFTKFDMQESGKDNIELHGNLYCYRQTGSKASEYNDGALVLTTNDTGNPMTLNIDGDVYVDGDIYLRPDATLLAKNIYCTGKIYICDFNSWGQVAKTSHNETQVIHHEYWDETRTVEVIDGYTVNAHDSASTVYGYYTISDTGTLVWHGLEGANPGVESHINSNSNLHNKIDYTLKRNNFPKYGYDPQSGRESESRDTLRDLYGDASANDIFKESLEHTKTDPSYTSAEHKDISQKYADAMGRTLDGSVSSLNDSDGNKVFEKTSYSAAKDGNLWKVYQSVKLTNNMASNATIEVILKDKDIVIAMPITSYDITYDGDGNEVSRTAKAGTATNNSARIRVHRELTSSDIAKGRTVSSSTAMLYFMYYDPLAEGECLYYDGDQQIKNSKGETLTYGGTDVKKGAAAKKDGRSRGEIKFGAQGGSYDGSSSAVVAEDIVLKNSTTTGDTLNVQSTEFVSNASDMSSYITYLVPDEVSFNFQNGGGSCLGQGMIYAINSEVDISISTDANKVLGQVKGQSVRFWDPTTGGPGDSTGKKVVLDCPMGQNSILDYVNKKNSSPVGAVEIQYFQY